jgi:outer membrane protein OmpA-like peptidoglycan-associated protein
MTDISPQNEPQEPEVAGNPLPQETGEPKAKNPPLPTSVLVMGFVSLALFGALVGVTVKKSTKADDKSVDSHVTDAQAQLQLLRSTYDQERQSLGLSPAIPQGGAQSADAIAARLKDDANTLAAMARNVEKIIADKQSEVVARTNDWQEAVKQLAILRQQNQALSDQLSKAVLANASASDLQNQLSAANSQIKSLTDQLLRLQKQPQDLQGSLADMTAQRDELLRKIKELRAEMANATIFASSESQMFREAVSLYRSLQGLENLPDSEIARAYSQFGANLGATVLDKIDFPTGSADLTPETLLKVQSFAEKAPDNALLFVVGYASETGDVDQNRSLSSNRATNVAKSLENSIKGNQRVQAAYLGQTDRFGSKYPERNQICEIWQIVPKN